MIVPFDENKLRWRTNFAMNITAPKNISFNVHTIWSEEKLVDYLHQSAEYLMKKTWLQAIKVGLFSTLPGLSYQLEAKFLTNNTKETAARHLHWWQQGIRSTKRNNTVEDLESELDGNKTIKEDRTQRIGAHLVALSEFNRMIATDQTGIFPIVSERGNKYIMVLYNYNLNAFSNRSQRKNRARISRWIQHIVWKTHQSSSKTSDTTIRQWSIEGFDKLHWSKRIKYQLASLYNHKFNLAKCMIKTFKNHQISNLHGCGTEFPAR